MKIYCAPHIRNIASLLLLFCLLPPGAHAQQTGNDFLLQVHFTGKDSAFTPQQLGIQTSFNSQPEAIGYITKLASLLAARGYPAASIDSSWETGNVLHIQLYAGTKYNWVQVKPFHIAAEELEAAGFREKQFENRPLNISQIQLLKQRLLNYYEKTGYPFAAVYLDSVSVSGDQVNALLKADKGTLYHIDSIRVFGKLRINKRYLQRYLEIPKGSVYNKSKLELVDKRMMELPYLQPVQTSDLTMLGSGAVLNLYVQPKRSSQVNFIVGFLPAANESGKLQLTGDVNLDLKNLMGTGESLLLKWQQLQPKSPRLNLGYDQPYIFNSPFGFSFLFDLFKKDSNFLQVNAQAGVKFNLASNQSGKLFVQWQNSSLLSGAIDTNAIKFQKTLPPNIDLTAVNVGFNFEWQNTNYRFNPRSGNEVNFTTVAGIKNIKQNADITSIKDPSFNYAGLYDSIKPRSYQLRLKVKAAHYFPVGKTATVKTELNSGIFSSPSVFRNELFQVGGYRLLRGFDEESIYASGFAVFTAEYRYLLSLNSYLFSFIDVGWTKNKHQLINVDNQFLGTGLGILYETKAGLLNLSVALGKRDDVRFNLRQASKIHFGYINYF